MISGLANLRFKWAKLFDSIAYDDNKGNVFFVKSVNKTFCFGRMLK